MVCGWRCVPSPDDVAWLRVREQLSVLSHEATIVGVIDGVAAGEAQAGTPVGAGCGSSCVPSLADVDWSREREQKLKAENIEAEGACHIRALAAPTKPVASVASKRSLGTLSNLRRARTWIRENLCHQRRVRPQQSTFALMRPEACNCIPAWAARAGRSADAAAHARGPPARRPTSPAAPRLATPMQRRGFVSPCSHRRCWAPACNR